MIKMKKVYVNKKSLYTQLNEMFLVLPQVLKDYCIWAYKQTRKGLSLRLRLVNYNCYELS